MIITRIIGGLGNQMFQYAAGRALSLKNSTDLALDISEFENYELHQGFELQRIFGSPFVIASEEDIRMVLGWQSPAGIRRILSRRSFASFIRRRLVVEPHFNYWPGIHELSKNCYLSGYWQSEKYFAIFASQIREDFTFRHPFEEQNAELAEKILQVNAISLHIRRGDYANNPNTTATHGLCSLDYYRESLQYIVERVENPQFFIFSDDITWAKINLKIEFPHIYVQHNCGTESYNDMRLMSLCRHHIIANSSFSWWGAWLNQSAEKIVIAPRKWFSSQLNVQDLFPDSWVTL